MNAGDAAMAVAVGLLVAGCVEPARLEHGWTNLDQPASAEVWATSEQAARALLEEIPQAMERVEAVMSARRPDAELSRHLAGRLAGYRKPRRIAYLEALPRTASGKIDRRRAAAEAGPRLRRLDNGRAPGHARAPREETRP